eukprot:gene13251-biopygen13372
MVSPASQQQGALTTARSSCRHLAPPILLPPRRDLPRQASPRLLPPRRDPRHAPGKGVVVINAEQPATAGHDEVEVVLEKPALAGHDEVEVISEGQGAGSWSAQWSGHPAVGKLAKPSGSGSAPIPPSPTADQFVPTAFVGGAGAAPI